MGDQSLPEWMKNEFFTESLQRKYERQDIVVTSFTTSTVVPPGNNYGSFILRVKVHYKSGEQDESLSLIVKSEHHEGPMKDAMDEFHPEQMKLFEHSFYYNFIPAAKKFIDTSFVPSAYPSSKPNVTILEDLKERGYIMADRYNQLDFDHCSLYMKAAAKFHSVSVAVYRDHPELLEPIKINFFSEDSKVRGGFEIMSKGALHCFLDEIEKVDRFKKYSKSIKKALPEMWGLFCEINQPDKFIKTIKQSDPWTTNMLFKYDGGKVCDIKLIDFQATHYGSPVSDLIFFIWSSATNDVKKSKLEELYRIYLETLNSNLDKFKCNERVTFTELQEEVRKFSPHTLFVAACNLPFFRDPEPLDMGKLFASNDVAYIISTFKKYYHEEYCSKYFPQLLECLENAGVFDYFERRYKRDD